LPAASAPFQGRKQADAQAFADAEAAQDDYQAAIGAAEAQERL